MMKGYGVHVPQGEVAYTPEQAKQVADKLGKCVNRMLFSWMVRKCWSLSMHPSFLTTHAELGIHGSIDLLTYI